MQVARGRGARSRARAATRSSQVQNPVFSSIHVCSKLEPTSTNAPSRSVCETSAASSSVKTASRSVRSRSSRSRQKRISLRRGSRWTSSSSLRTRCSPRSTRRGARARRRHVVGQHSCHGRAQRRLDRLDDEHREVVRAERCRGVRDDVDRHRALGGDEAPERPVAAGEEDRLAARGRIPFALPRRHGLKERRVTDACERRAGTAIRSERRRGRATA